MPALAAEKKVITAAVIGVGKAGGGGPKGGGHAIGYQHARMLQANPRVRLEAGADINAANLTAFREHFTVPQGFTDHHAMLRALKPDVVTIGTYVGLHARLIEDAARAGVKGIVCEKPFLAAPAEIQAVRRVVAETGVKIVVGHMRRYRPAFERARQLYNDGTVGRPVLCSAGIEGWDLSEWGSHWLDIFRFFHQDRPVRWVMGQARVRDFRGYGHAMEEHGVAYFEFEDGGKGLVDGGRPVDGGTLTLVGTEGVIRVKHESEVTFENGRGRTVESFKDHPAQAKIWDLLLEDLLRWIEGGPEPRVGHTSMFQTCELNLAAYLSAVKGDRIDLPLTGALAEYAEWPVEELARRNVKQMGS